MLAVLFSGCREGTAVLVRVNQNDVTIPTDVASIRLMVTNPEHPAANPTFATQILPLCKGDGASCYTLPLSVTLQPGDQSPDALVRTEMIAFDSAGTPAIDDVAEFHFTRGQQSVLDFFLSKSCLATQCGAAKKICGMNGGCETGVLSHDTSADAASPDPSGVISRWSEYQGNGTPGLPTYVLPPPNPLPGDTVLLAIQASAFPDGWKLAFGGGSWSLLYRILDGTESAETTYLFPPSGLAPWLLVSYRGVSKVVVGPVEGAVASPRYDFVSMDVPRAGSVLTAWFAASNVWPDCVHSESVLNVLGDVAGAYKVTETPPLAVGPSGEFSFVCPMGASMKYGAEVLLVP